MFGRKRRKQRLAAAAAATPVEAPGSTEPAPAPEPEPVRYFAEGAEPAPASPPPPAVEPEPAPEPDAPPEPVPVLQFTPIPTPGSSDPGPPAPDTPGPELAPAVVPAPEGTRALAERMRTSQHEMAQLSMRMDAWMDQAAQLRTELIVEWSDEDLRPEFLDLVVRAVARSLVRHPALNGTVGPDGIELAPTVNVGVATPVADDITIRVVPATDRCSLKDLVTAARPRESDAPDADAAGGPTFVVASLGEFGVDSFTPVVLAPNVATLGIGRVRDETRWDGDRPVRAQAMTLVLAWDHRAFGGVTAAEFLVQVREMLEQPYRLLVD